MGYVFVSTFTYDNINISNLVLIKNCLLDFELKCKIIKSEFAFPELSLNLNTYTLFSKRWELNNLFWEPKDGECIYEHIPTQKIYNIELDEFINTFKEFENLFGKGEFPIIKIYKYILNEHCLQCAYIISR